MEGPTAEAEDAGGTRFVAVGFLEDEAEVLDLEIAEPSGRDDLTARAGMLGQWRREIVQLDRRTVRARCGGGDDGFQLVEIPGPGIGE